MLKVSSFLVVSAFFILALVLFMAFNPGVYNVGGNIMSGEIISRVQTEHRVDAPAQYAVVTGDGESPVTENAKLALDSLHLAHTSYTSVSDFAARTTGEHSLIVTVSDVSDGELEQLKQFLSDGGSVVFCILPEYAQRDNWKALLGIADISGGYTVEGFEIYDKILLGGTFAAEEWSFDCARVSLRGTCKVFANGFNPLRDKDADVIEREDTNPLIWRTYYDDGELFLINAPFMDDLGGVGILTGIISSLRGDILYPIVGAKTVVLESFPYITDPTRTINNRSVYAFTRDIMWPDLISIAKQFRVTYTCLTNGGFAVQPDAAAQLNVFAVDLYKHVDGELGYAAGGDETTAQYDTDFLRDNLSDFKMRSYMSASRVGPFIGGDVTAIVHPAQKGEFFSWVGDSTVSLTVSSYGIADERQSLNFASALSAMGYSMHSIDMAKPIDGFDGSDAWNLYAVEVSKYFSYLFKKTDYIPAMTASRTAEAVKNYLNSDVEVTQSGETISATVSGSTGTVSFLLRTDKAIERYNNCVVTKIEDGAYLVKSDAAAFEITLGGRP